MHSFHSSAEQGFACVCFKDCCKQQAIFLLDRKKISIHFVSASQHGGHFLKLLHGCSLSSSSKARHGFDPATAAFLIT